MPKKLRTLRELKALTQKELANKAGISEAALNRIETGQAKARPSTRRKLALALGVSPSYISF